MLSSPFIARPLAVNQIMLRVLLALLPGIALYVWFFGPAILVSITVASLTALATEAAMLKLRHRPLKPFLSDNSALLTAWLLALSVPPLAPWWLVVVGTAFAIAVAKQLYGGLGNNPFNPAMIGYAVLIISFPHEMTHWLSPQALGAVHLPFAEQMVYFFRGVLPAGLTLDAITMSTPLDTLKTQLHLGHSVGEIRELPIYGRLAGQGTEMIALGFAAGGLYLLFTRIISWHLPLVFLATLFGMAGIFHLVDPAHYVAPPVPLVLRRGDDRRLLHPHRSDQFAHHRQRQGHLRGRRRHPDLSDPCIRRFSRWCGVRHHSDEYVRADH